GTVGTDPFGVRQAELVEGGLVARRRGRRRWGAVPGNRRRPDREAAGEDAGGRDHGQDPDRDAPHEASTIPNSPAPVIGPPYGPGSRSPRTRSAASDRARRDDVPVWAVCGPRAGQCARNSVDVPLGVLEAPGSSQRPAAN